jgi:tetratricopeptide (TPR) repeat protein
MGEVIPRFAASSSGDVKLNSHHHRKTSLRVRLQGFYKCSVGWNKYTLDSVNKSLDFFNRAIQIDPSYAPAYVGLADAHINLIFAYNVGSPASGCEKAEREPQKALEIDDAFAEAHAALARFKLQCAWDWAGAEREFRQAIDLAPGSSKVHHQYAHYLMAMGRIAEAWGESTRALELDKTNMASE